MELEARFRRRANLGDNIHELNDRLLDSILQIQGLVKIGKSKVDAVFDAGQGESSALDITSCLASGIRGAVSYASRLPAAIVDRAISDDVFTLQWDVGVVDFQWVSRVVFPQIVETFVPYRGAIVTDLDQDLDDFEAICRTAARTGRDIDGRDSIFRIQTVNYFDDTLCVREFGLKAVEIASRLSKKIELARAMNGGVLVVVSNEPSTGSELLDLDNKVRLALSIPYNG